MSSSSRTFLLLPLELRTLVYSHLLAPKPDESVVIFHNDFTRPREPSGIFTSILRASKQVYLEACPILYRNNTFRIDLAINPGTEHLTSKSARHQSWDKAFSAYQKASCTPSCAVISEDTLKRMRHIELIARHEIIRGYAILYEGYRSHLGGLLIDIIRILAGKDRRAIGVNKLFPGGDVDTSKSLTIYVKKQNRRFIGDCCSIAHSWCFTWTGSQKRELENKVRILRKVVEMVAGRRHLELLESCETKDGIKDEVSSYKSTDIDSVLMIPTELSQSWRWEENEQ